MAHPPERSVARAVVALPSPADTHALGRRIGLRCDPGTTLALIGPLGAGKTAFVRGLAEGLGVPSRIQSPTFVLVHSHEGGRLPLFHADLYRLDDLAQARALGLDELGVTGVVAVEWADLFPEVLPDDHLVVALAGDDGRIATITATGPQHAPLVAAAGVDGG